MNDIKTIEPSQTTEPAIAVDTVLAPVNYVAIVCKYSNEGKTCGELFNKTENCKNCDWNKQYEYSFSTLSSGWQLCPNAMVMEICADIIRLQLWVLIADQYVMFVMAKR